MKKLLVLILLLAGLCSIAFCQPAESESDSVTVFLTGYELGMLKPCGCSGGQLGGLERRLAIFESAGIDHLVVDTGNFVRDDTHQELIKFNIMVQAYNLLGYDVVNFTERDIRIADSLGLADSIEDVFNVISSCSADATFPHKFTKKFALKDGTVQVTVASFDAVSSSVEQAAGLFGGGYALQTVNILIINSFDEGIIDSIAAEPQIDCIVYPSQSDEPQLLSRPGQQPLVFSLGRYGRYVTCLKIHQVKPVEPKDNLTAGKKPDCSQKAGIDYSVIPVTEDLRQEESLVQLYKIYQQLVRQAGLLEEYPRVSLDDGLKYIGSESCLLCHDYEYDKWSTKEAHSSAYSTLERVGSQYDPECVVCHVVGMDYESGFVSEQKTPYLKNVGCENCHGPGLAHVQTLGKTATSGPQLDCIDCHNAEQSADYSGNEHLYMEKITHWREPNASSGVEN